VDTVVFDKTGTLTLGRPEATNLDSHAPRDLAVALALASGSAHPLAQALAEAARAAGVEAAKAAEIHEVPGYGVEGRIGGETVRFGRARWVGAEPGESTAAWLRIGGGDPVEFTFADRPRPGVEAMLAALSAKGLALHLISGDAEAPVAALAARLGIASWRAGALPEEKAAYVEGMKAEGRKVLMVGDGLNDTAALAAAHVSISPASALDAARTASDVVLLGQSLAPVAEALGVARRAVRLMLGNIVISNLYNLVAVPVAILGFATPLAAALAMSTSSVTVTLNALRLRK